MNSRFFFPKDQQEFSTTPWAGTGRRYNVHVYTSLPHNAYNVHCWKAAQKQEEMQLLYKAFLEVVHHTKFERGKASKFCGIITGVESFNMVLCSQKLTRCAISKSIYITRIIFLFQDWNVCPYLKKGKPYNLTKAQVWALNQEVMC